MATVDSVHLFDLESGNVHALDNVWEESGHVVVAHSHVGDNLLEGDFFASEILVLFVIPELFTQLCDFALPMKRSTRAQLCEQSWVERTLAKKRASPPVDMVLCGGSRESVVKELRRMRSDVRLSEHGVAC